MGNDSCRVTPDMRRAEICRKSGSRNAAAFAEGARRERQPPLSATSTFSARDATWTGDCNFIVRSSVATEDGKPIVFEARVHFDPEDATWHLDAETSGVSP